MTNKRLIQPAGGGSINCDAIARLRISFMSSKMLLYGIDGWLNMLQDGYG
jgi:hypothetical protein